MKYKPVLLKSQISTIKRLLDFPDVIFKGLSLNEDNIGFFYSYKNIEIQVKINKRGLIQKTVFYIDESVYVFKDKSHYTAKEIYSMAKNHVVELTYFAYKTNCNFPHIIRWDD